jgi:hypothetical protein
MVGAMTTYHATATRGTDGWWSIDFTDVPYTYSQSRRLDQIETKARSAIAAQFDVAPDSFDVVITYALPTELQQAVDDTTAIRRQADATAAAAQAALRATASRLSNEGGLSVRDIGVLLGVSHQRVAQVLEGGK